VQFFRLDSAGTAAATLQLMRGGCAEVPFHARGIAPKVFEAVKGAFGLMEDMDNYLEIIEHDPLAGRKSVDGGRANAVILF